MTPNFPSSSANQQANLSPSTTSPQPILNSYQKTIGKKRKRDNEFDNNHPPYKQSRHTL